MQFFELLTVVKLEKDMQYLESYEFLSKFLSSAMLRDDELSQLHARKTIKPLNFCNLYPAEPDGIYRKGRLYSWNVRSFDADLIVKLRYMMQKAHKDSIVMTEIKQRAYRPISEISTLTPAVAIVEDKSWVKEDGLSLLSSRIVSNTAKKCKMVFGDFEEREEEFFEYVEVVSNRGIKIPYKKNSFLAYQLKLAIKPDELSQKLGYTILGCGLLEKNAIGLGFCRAK